MIAFYAAVHYVNAYLWEARQFVPASHPERSRAVHAEAALRPARDSYGLLRDYGYEARYTATFTATDADARELVQFDLRRVEDAVLRAVGLPVPLWEDTGPH